MSETGTSCIKPAGAVSASSEACAALAPTAQRCSPLLPVSLSISSLCRSDDARAALHWVQVQNSMGRSGHEMLPHPECPEWNALGAKLKRLSEAWSPTTTLPQPHTHLNAQQNSEAWQRQHVDGEAAQGGLQPGLAAHMGQVSACSAAAHKSLELLHTLACSCAAACKTTLTVPGWVSDLSAIIPW